MKSAMQDGFFCYATALNVGLTDGSTITPSINISNDADFEVFELRAVIYKLAARTGSVLMSMSLASGELFSNVAVDLFAIAAQNIQNESGYPVRFPFYTRIPANSQINVQLTNNTGAAINIQVQLWGKKVE
jgi:type V secretory pathway adhesin AidA